MKSLFSFTTNITLAFIFATMLSCSDNKSSNSDDSMGGTDDDPIPSENIDIPGSIRNISSVDLVAEMGVGWNLGNSLDVESTDKTAWGNPLPSQQIINTVYDMGFRTLRVPVTWRFHQQSTVPYTIDENYLTTVQETVNYGITKGMHVILNLHHDNTWVRPTAQDAPQVKQRLESLWTQIAERFKAYGDKLIFETMNENRLLNSPEEWSGGTAEGRSIVNEYHLTALNAIRNTGGNNTGRHIMISTYAASTVPAAMNDLEIPNNDARIIISLHTYFPWEFAGLEGGTAEWGTELEKAELVAEMDRIRDKWVVQEQRSVILGEWGAVDRNNIQAREDYYQFYVDKSTERGLLPIVWDDGGNFRLLDRNNLSWHFESLAQAIIDAGN